MLQSVLRPWKRRFGWKPLYAVALVAMMTSQGLAQQGDRPDRVPVAELAPQGPALAVPVAEFPEAVRGLTPAELGIADPTDAVYDADESTRHAPTDIVVFRFVAVPKEDLARAVQREALANPLSGAVAEEMLGVMPSLRIEGFTAATTKKGTTIEALTLSGDGERHILLEWKHASNCNALNSQGNLTEVTLAGLVDHDGLRRTIIAAAASQQRHLAKLPAGSRYVDKERHETTPIAKGENWEVKLMPVPADEKLVSLNR